MFNKKLLAFAFCLLSFFALPAQNAEMADTFRGEGKIYVVVGVMLILLVGLFIYMFRIERKVKKLENE
jgi:FtsH-binding integral membrane protein